MKFTKKIRRITDALVWRLFIWSSHRWAAYHMDQWEKVKFDTEYGEVYLTLSRRDEYPDSFDKVDNFGYPQK